MPDRHHTSHKDSYVFGHVQPPVIPPYIQACFELAEVANCLLGMVNDHFNDSPPPEKNFSGNTDYIPVQLVLCPNQPINHSEAQICFWVSQNFAAHHISCDRPS
jgi:hypothetical protein